MKSDAHKTSAAPAVLHETAEIAVRPVAIFAIALMLLCAAAGFAMHGLFRVFDRAARARDVPGHPLALERELPPPPRLQANPGLDQAHFRERERAELESYGWVDRDAGVVHLPIERAMQLLLERGLPVRAEDHK